MVMARKGFHSGPGVPSLLVKGSLKGSLKGSIGFLKGIYYRGSLEGSIGFRV